MKQPPTARRAEYLDKIIRERFSGALMSDRKWVKLLDQLVAHACLIKKCRVKLIWEDHCRRELLINQHTLYPFDYYDSAVESMISGTPPGWYAYREIEWLAFPRKTGAAPDDPVQDIEAIHRLLEPLGELCLERDEEELKIYAYK
ncbi:MAG: hypothetical protein ICV83_13850 [Cytophagales bacterium]|nr:hypothetical protein [Cytophagales bacterium]